MELQNPLNKPNRFAYGKHVTVINDNPPTDQSFGVHKSDEQSGISVTLEESHFMIWKLENGTYVEFGEVNQKSAIVLGWTDGVDGYYFQSLTPTPKLEIRITGIVGNIVVDSDPNDGIGEGEADLLAFNGQINQGNIGTIGFGQKGEKGQKGEAGGYATSFSGAHSITEDRNSTASLGSVTVDSGLSYIGGELITITAGHDLGYMQYAQVTSYSGTTLEFNHIESSTNYSESTDWNINLTGKIGTDGTSVKYATIFDAPHGTDESRGPNESLGSLTIETGLSYIGGEYITVSPVVSPESIQVARVTSYDASTGVITFEHISHTGSQAYSDSGDWNLNLSGRQGEKGDKGEAGADGVIGVDGAVGAKGEKGDQGAIGIPGLQGQAGMDGVGIDGAKGDKGEAGLDGSATNQGQKGDKGESSDMGGTMTSHIIPDSNASYDLGNAEYKIRHLFLSDNSMYIGDSWLRADGGKIKMPSLVVSDINLNNDGQMNEVDGTSGHWSIQEGSDDLFLINRLNGKKYKFNLTEM